MNGFEKPNFTKIAKELGIHRDTARAYYNGKIAKVTRSKESKVEKHKPIIRELLDDKNRSPRL